MQTITMLDVRLDLFDGEGAGDGAAAAQTGRGVQPGEAQGGPASTRQGRTGDAQENAPAAGEQAEEPIKARTAEERKKAFRELVRGEYRDIYAEETQRIINQRFRETKELEEALNARQPVLDMLMQRYRIEDGDIGKLAKAVENDDVYWAAAAEESGMTVEQYKRFEHLRRENEALQKAERDRRGADAANRQMEKWYSEASEMQEDYPDFVLAEAAQDSRFLSMLRSGVPVRNAYEVLHMEDVKAAVAQKAAESAEKRVVDGIRSKGARPQENGTSAQSGFTTKTDVSKLTKEERAALAKRAMRGEEIRFS